MDDENMKKAIVASVLILWSGAFAFLPLLFWMAEEGTIKKENLLPFVAGLTAFQVVIVVILLIRAYIKDNITGE